MDQLQFWWNRGLLCGHAVVMPNQGHSIILVVAPLIGTPSLSLNQGRQGQPLVSCFSLFLLVWALTLYRDGYGEMAFPLWPSLCVMSNGCEKFLKGWKRSLALLETRISLVGRNDKSLRFIEEAHALMKHYPRSGGHGLGIHIRDPLDGNTKRGASLTPPKL